MGCHPVINGAFHGKALFLLLSHFLPVPAADVEGGFRTGGAAAPQRNAGAAPCFLVLDFDGLDPHAAAQKP